MELLSMEMDMWMPLGFMRSVELLAYKWKPWNRQNLHYFMKTPKTFGSIFKIEIFSMDLEVLIQIDIPNKAIYMRR